LRIIVYGLIFFRLFISAVYIILSNLLPSGCIVQISTSICTAFSIYFRIIWHGRVYIHLCSSPKAGSTHSEDKVNSVYGDAS